MVKIYTSKGMFALVDDADKELVDRYSWHFDRYAKTNLWEPAKKKLHCVYMHRLIMNAPKELQVDHINENKLDNRRKNLRLVERCVNIHNKKSSRKNTSGYRGVCWDKSHNNWMSYINYGGKRINLGRYHDKISAAIRYNEAVDIYYPNSRWKNNIVN